MSSPTARLVGALLIAAGVVWLCRATPADAHALLRSSSPRDGSSVQREPAAVSLTFTERPDPDLSAVTVIGPGRMKLSGPARPVPGRPSTLRVPLRRGGGRGVYTVQWRTVSAVDGHVTAGTFTFAVGAAAPPPARVGTAGSPTAAAGGASLLDTVGRWLLYCGLAGLVGGTALRLWVFDDAEPPSRLGLGIAAAAAVVGWIVTVVAEATSAGAGPAALFRSPAGRAVLEQGTGLVAAAIGAALYSRLHARRAALLTLAGALAAIALHALAGHAAAVSPAAVAIGLQALHVAAVSAWVGGLAWLVVRSVVPGPRLTRGTVGRFSTLAGFALGVVVASGVVRAFQELGGLSQWPALFRTAYGWTVVAKAALLIPLAGLGAVNRYVHLRRPGEGDFPRRALAGEVSLGAAILVAAAVLSQLVPPVDIAATAARAPEAVTASGHDAGLTLEAHLRVIPGRPGVNSFLVTVRRYRTNRPVRARYVRLQLASPRFPSLGASEVALRPRGGAWVGRGTALSAPGPWNADVLVQTASTGADIHLRLRVPAPPERVTVSRVPGQPTVYTVHLAQGEMQAYVDPGRPGINNVHFTFFTPAGKELPVRQPRARAVGPQGRISLHLRRFSAGHLVATTRLGPGRWTFHFTGRSDRGAVTARFTTRIEGS